MPTGDAECKNCGHVFDGPDVDDQGKRLKCPECGQLARIYHLKVKSGVHFQTAVSAKLTVGKTPDLESHFDISELVGGTTIVACSGIISQKIIDHFHKYPEELKVLDRRRFEELVAELFDGFGYEVELTKRTRDGGCDIIAVKRAEVDVKFLIECKRPEPGGYVGVVPVRSLLGVKTDQKATKVILATTTRFSKDARLLYERHLWELELKEYEDLKNWIARYRKLKGIQ